MNRVDYIYQLVGRITDRKIKKKQDGNRFIQLAVVIPEKEPVKKINVFTDSCKNKEIWPALEENQYLGKEYLFYCKNFMGSYYLIDWELLSGHGSN